MPINKLAQPLEWCLHQHLATDQARSRPLHSAPGQARPDQARPDELAIVWVHKFSKRDTRKPASKPA